MADQVAAAEEAEAEAGVEALLGASATPGAALERVLVAARCPSLSA